MKKLAAILALLALTLAGCAIPAEQLLRAAGDPSGSPTTVAPRPAQSSPPNRDNVDHRGATTAKQICSVWRTALNRGSDDAEGEEARGYLLPLTANVTEDIRAEAEAALFVFLGRDMVLSGAETEPAIADLRRACLERGHVEILPG